jgi:hypothetical protein
MVAKLALKLSLLMEIRGVLFPIVALEASIEHRQSFRYIRRIGSWGSSTFLVTVVFGARVHGRELPSDGGSRSEKHCSTAP